MVVMKLEVKESSENRRRRQLLPTPAEAQDKCWNAAPADYNREDERSETPENPPLSPISKSLIR